MSSGPAHLTADVSVQGGEGSGEVRVNVGTLNATVTSDRFHEFTGDQQSIEINGKRFELTGTFVSEELPNGEVGVLRGNCV